MSFGNYPQLSPLSFNRLLRIAFFIAVFTVLFGILLIYQHQPTRVWSTTGVVSDIGNGPNWNKVDTATESSLNSEESLPQPPGVVEVEEEIAAGSEAEHILQSELKVEVSSSTSAPRQRPVFVLPFLSHQPSNRTLQLSKRFKKVDQIFWSSIEKTVTCQPQYLKRIGGESKWDVGAKWTCGLKEIGNTYLACDPLKPCTLFSFGMKENSLFEAELLEKTCCKVFAYDPADTKIGKPISPTNPRVKFQQLAVGKENVNNTKKFKTLMEENGYDWVDVVKMDIEGDEYAVLQNIFDEFETIPIGMLLVGFHSDDPRKILDIFDKLEEKGMRMFHSEVNPFFPDYACEYSFINVNA